MSVRSQFLTNSEGFDTYVHRALQRVPSSSWLGNCCCRCTKVGALVFTPLLVHGEPEPRAMATHNRAKEGSRREAEGSRQTRQHQGPRPQSADGRSRLPRQDPCRGQPPQPRCAPCRGSSPTLAERATLKPMASNVNNHVGPGLGRHLHGGMQIFVKT